MDPVSAHLKHALESGWYTLTLILVTLPWEGAIKSRILGLMSSILTSLFFPLWPVTQFPFLIYIIMQFSNNVLNGQLQEREHPVFRQGYFLIKLPFNWSPHVYYNPLCYIGDNCIWPPNSQMSHNDLVMAGTWRRGWHTLGGWPWPIFINCFLCLFQLRCIKFTIFACCREAQFGIISIRVNCCGICCLPHIVTH